MVCHGGGYPGFGSHMRWHPASGLGMIAFANHRYGPAGRLANEMLVELLRLEAVPVRRTRANAATLAARDTVERLIDAWDDDVAAEAFAMNIHLDEPLELRKAAIAKLRDVHGRLRRDDDTPDESPSSFHLTWWLRGDRGRVRVDILLSPEMPPKIQTFSLTSVPEPPEQLRRAAERLVATLGAPATGPVAIDWPNELAVSANVDVGQVVRSMRATEARFAPLSIGQVVESDGEKKATFRLAGPRGRDDLALTLDPEAGCLDAVSLTPVRHAPPVID
jgi:hypothetical protein